MINMETYDDDDCTDTETSSDDWTEDVQLPVATHMTEQEVAEQVYCAYRQAKRVWRRLIEKPARRVRRILKG